MLAKIETVEDRVVNWLIYLAAALVGTMTLATHPSAAVQPCLSYTGRVQLSGSLVRRTFPGPPNYQSIAAGDLPEIYWLVQLDEPICVDPDSDDPMNGPTAGVTAVQLVLTPEQYNVYGNLVGHHLSVEGRLFSAFTGHHHTPVLMEKVTFVKAAR
jgi:Domain of unknown function (DUF4431)